MITIDPANGTGATPQDPQRDEALNAAAANPSKYVVVIDRDLCIGATSCVDLAVQTFALDDENRAVLRDPPWDSEEQILAAAKSCPTLAIIVRDRETGEQIFPA